MPFLLAVEIFCHPKSACFLVMFPTTIIAVVMALGGFRLIYVVDLVSIHALLLVLMQDYHVPYR